MRTYPAALHGQRSAQSLADAVASTHGCAGAILLGREGEVIAKSPPDATFPAGAVTALQRLRLADPAATAWTVLLPRHTLVVRRIGDRRILAALLEPGADSAPVRGVLAGLLPATLAMLEERVPPLPARTPAPARPEPGVVEVPREPAAEAPSDVDRPAAAVKEAPSGGERPRRRVSALSLLVAFALGIALGAAIWAWASNRPAFLGGMVQTAAPGPSIQPSATREATPTPSPAPTPTPTATPMPTPAPSPPLQLTHAGDLAHGTSGEAVRALQARLKQLRYFVYPEETGYFGDATYGAVYTFQRDRGLPTTGVADQATVAALNGCDQRCQY